MSKSNEKKSSSGIIWTLQQRTPTTTRQDADFNESVISRSLLEESIEWISSHLSPEDVFSDSDLVCWATENGYILDE